VYNDDYMLAAIDPETSPVDLARFILEERESDQQYNDRYYHSFVPQTVGNIARVVHRNPNFDPLAVIYIQSGYADSMSWEEFLRATML